MTDEIARLVELSGRGTQGEMDETILFIGAHNKRFAVALINWFRATHCAHQEELKEGRLPWTTS